jgi:hypothetical protein
LSGRNRNWQLFKEVSEVLKSNPSSLTTKNMAAKTSPVFCGSTARMLIFKPERLAHKLRRYTFLKEKSIQEIKNPLNDLRDEYL